MLVYILILLAILFGVFHYDYKNYSFGKKGYAIFIYVFLTLMVGLRYKVGGDSQMYEYYFPWMPNLENYFSFIFNDRSFNYQPFYLLFVAICKSISPDFYFYQFIHSVVVNSVICWFVYKYSEKFFTTIAILFVLCLYFYYTFEIQREILGICCFLLGYKYFINNKWIPYYVIAFIAFFFHVSAIILFLLPFIKFVNITKLTAYLIVLVSVILTFLKSFFVDFISVFLVTEAMVEKGKAYSEMEFSLTGLIFYFVGRVILFLPIILYYSKNKEDNKHIRDILAAFLILSSLSQVMVGFDRMLNYVTIPFVICFTHFIYFENNFENIIKKRIIIFSTFSCLFYFIGIKIAQDITITNRARYHAIYFPYYSVFDKDESVERERFMRELWKRN